jgi:hypothetical protein
MPQIVNPAEGPLVIYHTGAYFEPSNTVHLWLYPQRANMIANPNFELDTGYWASNGTITNPLVAGVGHVGHFEGGSPIVAESNEWPTRMGEDYAEWWTLKAMVKGDGRLKVGLISWDSLYRGTSCDWGTEEWTVYPGAWTAISVIRHAPQAYRCMMRLESTGTELTLDKVLAERGTLKEFGYFDGDSTYSAPESYGWYGGPQQQGKSYSMLYGSRRAVLGRLFSAPDDSDTLITDDDVKKAGLVYQWVPAGVSVVPHIDVFYPDDLRLPPSAKASTVYPYYAEDEPFGVVNPWVAAEVVDIGITATTSVVDTEL